MRAVLAAAIAAISLPLAACDHHVAVAYAPPPAVVVAHPVVVVSRPVYVPPPVVVVHHYAPRPVYRSTVVVSRTYVYRRR